MSMTDILQGFSGALAQLSKVDAAGEFGAMFVLRADWADLATGDIEIFNSNAPFAFRVIDVLLENQETNGANNNFIQVCLAVGTTNPITDQIPLTGVTDKTLVRAVAINDANTIAEGGSLYLRQTKAGGTMGGVCWIRCITL